MAASIDQIVATFPGIKNDPEMVVYIELAKNQTSSVFYGDRYNHAVALRAAHDLIMSNPEKYASLMSGGIVSKKQRNLSVEYGRSSGDNNTDKSGLSQTTYGKQLLGLMRMSNTTMGAIGVAT
jgi:hypothetical protein